MYITGHHHISMYTKDAQKNRNFYTQILGLRLVEKSVNQDNPTMYHLFSEMKLALLAHCLVFSKFLI